MSNSKLNETLLNVVDSNLSLMETTRGGDLLHEVRLSPDDRSRIDSLIKSINNLSDRLVILKDGHE